MAPFLTEFVFIGIIAAMLLLLAGLQAIANYNSRKRIRQRVLPLNESSIKPGAKIISLPQYIVKHGKTRTLVQETVSEEEMV